MKKTKIVATIGPASNSRENLAKLIKAGVNVVRLNFSHGDYQSHGKIIDSVRELSTEMKIPVGIMVDLQGPRIRTVVSEDVEINTGDNVLIYDTSSPVTNSKLQNYTSIGLDYPKIINDIDVGNEILIEDGLKRLKVIRKEKNYLEAKVINGGIIKNHKGVNIPDAHFHFSAVTEKDQKDLEFALSKEVDYIALSFVSNGQEVEAIRDKIKKILGRERNLPQIVSKIERKEAMKNINEIIKASDAIMVARGDLGIEMEESKVVIYQKEIIARCLKANRPVIVATQMLDSMINNPIPTRAEVSDVSNAVIDHTDAVMLSGESANGKYPLETVKIMSDIIKNVENSSFNNIYLNSLDNELFNNDYASLIDSAHELAKNSKAKAIIMYTSSGFTARMMSHHRPKQIMIAATNNLKTYNQLALVWGIRPYLLENGETRESFIDSTIEKAKKDKIVVTGDKVVIILGRASTGKGIAMIGIKEVI